MEPHRSRERQYQLPSQSSITLAHLNRVQVSANQLLPGPTHKWCQNTRGSRPHQHGKAQELGLNLFRTKQIGSGSGYPSREISRSVSGMSSC
mmetsp:Transcript_38762/g.83995  ORF Transcript_38762/g.83995 Transcript_38762/m.83995 type:complete len:92 (-) Transcript_38762:60-335(-)